MTLNVGGQAVALVNRTTYGGPRAVALVTWSASGIPALSTMLSTGDYVYGHDLAADQSGNLYAALGEENATLFFIPAGSSTPTEQTPLEPAQVRLAVDGNNDVYALGQVFQESGYVAKIAGVGAPLHVSITDAEGQPVKALKLNANGWPVLNADTEMYAHRPQEMGAAYRCWSTLLQETSLPRHTTCRCVRRMCQIPTNGSCGCSLQQQRCSQRRCNCLMEQTPLDNGRPRCKYQQPTSAR